MRDATVVKCLPTAGRADILLTALYTHLNVDVDQYCSPTYEEGAFPAQFFTDNERRRILERFAEFVKEESYTKIQVSHPT